jgi:hypothetical protein
VKAAALMFSSCGRRHRTTKQIGRGGMRPTGNNAGLTASQVRFDRGCYARGRERRNGAAQAPSLNPSVRAKRVTPDVPAKVPRMTTAALTPRDDGVVHVARRRVVRRTFGAGLAVVADPQTLASRSTLMALWKS